ncbi:MAG: Rne/Rng family ribonuclease [Acidimicrobiales bacterium]
MPEIPASPGSSPAGPPGPSTGQHTPEGHATEGRPTNPPARPTSGAGPLTAPVPAPVGAPAKAEPDGSQPASPRPTSVGSAPAGPLTPPGDGPGPRQDDRNPQDRARQNDTDPRDSGQPDRNRQDDSARPDSARPDDARPDSARPDDARSHDARPDDARPEDARPDGGNPRDDGRGRPRRGHAEPGEGANPEMPERISEGKPRSVEAAAAALVPRKPRIGDTMPAPPPAPTSPLPAPPSVPGQAPGTARTSGRGGAANATTADGGARTAADSGPADEDQGGDGDGTGRKRRRGGRGRGGAKRSGEPGDAVVGAEPAVGAATRNNGGGSRQARGADARSGGGRGGQGRNARGNALAPVEQVYDDEQIELDERSLKRRRGKERNGRPIGRYVMCVHVAPGGTQIAVLEGRSLVEHFVSKPSDGLTEIHGNIYLGKVQNVLPGMEAAFVDIGTPKNAVLYRGDVQYEKEDLEGTGPSQGGGGHGHGHGSNANKPRIEQVLKARQTILCQVTKNPIAHKGARLTQEVSLPGRFVVLIPNSSTYGISKRLPDNERKRLRQILDQVKPPQHGVIVRTAAEKVTEEEIERDVRRLVDQWNAIEALAKKSASPALLYREPDLALRVIREEFNDEYRTIVIDDPRLFEEVRSYVASISPTLADRVEFYDTATEPLPLFERHHVHEQRLRALDRKVWLPSGGSLIIEHTEALTVIDVNTGKNVGSSSLEETVYRNNLEAAVEIARQLRLRDIGGIIVIDFVDMETRQNRDEVIRVFREALGRDKTRTQVFEISELGLVEMTRKRIGEGLIESVSCVCQQCEGRGLILDQQLVGEDA